MGMAATQNDMRHFNITTDLPSAVELRGLMTDARKKNAPLNRLLTMVEAGEIRITDGAIIKINAENHVLDRVMWLYYLTVAAKPILTIETGFHQGLIAAAITLAHMDNALHGGHVPIQDRAKQVENGIGFKLFTDFSLSGFQIMEHEPAMVLPQVYLQNLNAGLRLAYFNFATSSDEQMMEYFYINTLLNEGGIMVINTDHAARRFLVDYLQKERHDMVLRTLECGLVLAQKPVMADVMADVFSVRH
jgi:hypothetical protein